MNILKKSPRYLFFLLFALLCSVSNGRVPEKMKIRFIDFYYENGSPLLWSTENDTLLKISLIPDYQRYTLNRQTDHWNFRIVADPGTHIRMTIEKMLSDVYNGREGANWWNYPKGIPCYLSYDYKEWTPVVTRTLPGNVLYLDFVMKESEIFLSRLPVYSLSNLREFLSGISGKKGIDIINAGKTAEGRMAEIIRAGNPEAKINIIIRARAHPWEPGGNWVLEGFIDRLINNISNKKPGNYCFYMIPLANKDGVARGMTRFSITGTDLNRGWDKEFDPKLDPENYMLDSLIKDMIARGHKPDLVIDLHNDDKGDIHLATRSKSDIQFRDNMLRFEKLMREKGLFSEDFRYQWKEDNNPVVMSIENGLYYRYGIESFVYELNANWLKGQGVRPSSAEWKKTGAGLLDVLTEYFRNN